MVEPSDLLRLEIPGQATDVLLVAKVLGFVVLPRKTDILC